MLNSNFENAFTHKILVIEDEEEIRNILIFSLQSHGFEVLGAEDGLTGFHQFVSAPPDLLILDLMLPKMSGIEICSRLKRDERFRDRPILFLTAKNGEEERIVGLEVGADDYMTKPFNLQELILRVKLLLQKSARKEASGDSSKVLMGAILEFGDLVVNPVSYEVWWKNKKINLTSLEFRLLYFMASRPNHVFERGLLLKHVWRHDAENITRTVDTHIVRLRTKLEEAGGFIETVRGVGYKFNFMLAKAMPDFVASGD